MGTGEDSYDPTAATHRALRGIRQELERHPIVTTVRGFPAGEFTRVRATLDLSRWGIERADATLSVRWFAGDTADARPEFSFHYSDAQTDFGWHHEPNPHVDGWGHFQARTTAEEYTYEAQFFATTNPTRLVWEVMSLLRSRFDAE